MVTNLEQRIAALEARTVEFASILGESLEIQKRTLGVLEGLVGQVARLAEAYARTEAQLGELVRVTTELAQRQADTEARIAELADRQSRTEERLAELADRQSRTEAQLGELVRVTTELVRVTTELTQRLGRLEDWQRGEQGRREGERYEAHVLRRLWAYLGRGWGGHPGEPEVRARLGEILADLDLDPQADPSLADAVWFKGTAAAVVEASITLAGEDVLRAKARAQTLKRVGYQALGVVIGQGWAPGAQELAEAEGVAWYIEGEGPSQALKAFRRQQP